MPPTGSSPAASLWGLDEPVWGVWRVPEVQVGMLAGALDGLDAIELGCGTGYVSAWLARRGARPVGIDNSQAQLDSVEFNLPHGERIALLRSSCLEIEELVEVRPPDGSTNTYHPSDSLEWAQKWPAEEIWKVRRR